MYCEKLKYLTIKQLTTAVGNGVTPRMVRHYHAIGLLMEAVRSPSNYRLYTQEHLQHLRRIIALKQQGFQLQHIRNLLQTEAQPQTSHSLTTQLQYQYHSIIQQITRLRQTASALEGLLGRDLCCKSIQAKAIAQLKILGMETQQLQNLQDELEQNHGLWDGFDEVVATHPESFGESLKHLLPPVCGTSALETELLTHLVLSCGDVSLVNFVKISNNAFTSAIACLKVQCPIIVDVPAVSAALDHPRLAHLGCPVITLMDDPHMTNATEIEQKFWQYSSWHHKLHQLPSNCILLVGYAPSVLMYACESIAQHLFNPSLIIGMPLGFSHAPAAKRLLRRSGVDFITTVGSVGGGLLSAVALNVLTQIVIDKPHCHCYLQ